MYVTEGWVFDKSRVGHGLQLLSLLYATSILLVCVKIGQPMIQVNFECTFYSRRSTMHPGLYVLLTTQFVWTNAVLQQLHLHIVAGSVSRWYLPHQPRTTSMITSLGFHATQALGQLAFAKYVLRACTYLLFSPIDR